MVAKDVSKRISESPRWLPIWLKISQHRSSGFQHAPRGPLDRSKTGPSAMQCYASLRNAMLCNAMQCYAMLRSAMPCYRAQSYAMLRNSRQCYLLLLLLLLVFRSSEVSPFRFSVLGGLSFSISRSSGVSPFRCSVLGGLSFSISRFSGVSPFRFSPAVRHIMPAERRGPDVLNHGVELVIRSCATRCGQFLSSCCQNSIPAAIGNFKLQHSINRGNIARWAACENDVTSMRV